MRYRARVPLAGCVLAALATLALAAAPAGAAKLPSSWQRGANMSAFWWRDFDDGGYDYWVRRARDNAGANWAVLTSTWYQYASDPLFTDSLGAVELHPSYGTSKACRKSDGSDFAACKTPSLHALAGAARKAKALGFRVAIKPLVDVGRNDRNRADRALINKGSDRAEWFANYAAMLSGYAQVARDTHADALVLGTGLTGMADEPEDWAGWRALAQGVRDEGYTGALTFGTNWDAIASDALSQEQRFFWDAMDYIGVEAYFPLARGADPSVTALRRGWYTDVGGYGDHPVDLVTKLQAKYGKPVVFTGLGYVSRNGTAARPEDPATGGRVNQVPQQNAYEAAFDVWSGIARMQRWFRGIWWWDWPANGRKAPGGYTPQTKKAEIVLCKWQGGGRKRPCYQ
jgi:Glycoside Hydrolase Family 113